MVPSASSCDSNCKELGNDDDHCAEIDSLKMSLFADESPTQNQPPLITVRIQPGEHGRFGFNVKVCSVFSVLILTGDQKG